MATFCESPPKPWSQVRPSPSLGRLNSISGSPMETMAGEAFIGLGSPKPNGRNAMAADNTANGKRRLRSREWFDAPGDPTMAALYLERYMNFGLTLGELHSNRPI